MNSPLVCEDENASSEYWNNRHVIRFLKYHYQEKKSWKINVQISLQQPYVWIIIDWHVTSDLLYNASQFIFYYASKILKKETVSFWCISSIKCTVVDLLLMVDFKKSGPRYYNLDIYLHTIILMHECSVYNKCICWVEKKIVYALIGVLCYADVKMWSFIQSWISCCNLIFLLTGLAWDRNRVALTVSCNLRIKASLKFPVCFIKRDFGWCYCVTDRFQYCLC